MTFSPLLLFVSALHLAGSAPADAPAAPAPICTAAPSSAGAPEVHCDYGAAAPTARILELLKLRSPGLTIDAVERIFGLPRLAAGYADPWTASYHILLRPRPGQGDWSLILSLRESFGPGVPGRRHHLRGTDRPVRIDPRVRGEMVLDISIYGTGPVGGGACLTPERLAEEGGRAGWRRQMPQPRHISHGLPLWYLQLKRGRLDLEADVTNEPACLQRLTLRQASNFPPEPGLAALRAAERDRLIVANADRMAAAMARTGEPEEDPDALRAYSQFIRDAHLRFDRMDGNPGRDIERQIAAMDEGEVRALATRLANGHPWGAAREDCEAAVRAPDPVEALARLSRRRGLSEPEAEALRTQCFVFVEGRRFRYRRDQAPPAAPRE